MKIKTQLRGIIVGLSIIAFSGIGSVYLNIMGNDSTVVNDAGLVRGGSQRLVKLEIVGKNGDALIAKLDKLVSGLINGDKDLGLPPATDKEFIFKMQQVKSNWGNLKNTINQARQEPKYQSVLVTESEIFFNLANEAVGSAENFSQKKIQKLSMIQLAIFALNLIILAVIVVVGRNITSNLQKYTTSIAASSTQIAEAIEDQELTAVQQAVSVQQISTTIEELGASSQQSAEQAQASTLGASQALVLAEGGTKTVQQTLDEMLSLKESVEAIAEQILCLSEQTNQIGNVSGLVGDLANQTNMLALNAAVEAARAGEHGKGFGVVASEVRKLADQSKKSAEKINALVTDIQTAINTTVMVTDKGTKTVAEGMQMTQGTAESFTGVADSVNNIFLNSQQISFSAKQQAIAIQQVVDAMNAINSGTKKSSSGITQVRTSTQQLKNTAQMLKAMV